MKWEALVDEVPGSLPSLRWLLVLVGLDDERETHDDGAADEEEEVDQDIEGEDLVGHVGSGFAARAAAGLFRVEFPASLSIWIVSLGSFPIGVLGGVMCMRMLVSERWTTTCVCFLGGCTVCWDAMRCVEGG